MTEKNTLPNFLLVGAAKCGTTSLYHYMKGHPQIHFSPVKEPCYFTAQFLKLPQVGPGDERKLFTPNLADYTRLFAEAGDRPAIGEGSVDTLYYYERTIPLIRSLLGDPRILIILRNPVERAFSAWHFKKRDEQEPLSFEAGLAAEDERIGLNWNAMWHYRRRGLYHGQVKAFMESFRRVRVFLHEDLQRDAAAVVRQAFEFLDVDTGYRPDNLDRRYQPGGIPRWRILNRFFANRNPLQRALRGTGSRLLSEDRWVRLRDAARARLLVKERMQPETRRQLQDFFRDDIRQLQELLGCDLSAWLA